MSKQDIRNAVEHKGRLPRGIPPEHHAACAAALEAPIMGKVLVADDLDFALRMTTELKEKDF